MTFAIDVAMDTSKKSFTFLELMVIILIMGILLGVSLPHFKKVSENFGFENFIKNIYFLTLHLQSRAIADSKIYYLEIKKNTLEFQPYLLNGDEYVKLSAGVFGKIQRAPLGTSLLEDPRDIPGLHFYPDGSCDSATLTFKNNNDQKTSLFIKGMTGEIQLH